ncbi:Predicted dehydrogenase [Octadecabacter temperatus]|uniref:Glucose--fructose oxidoreductase n=1 Tax=Octadecabacter temperatus TaxID=1458307 RepID=A0A0K0Y6R9_9RHOB|nr:Glucose--fructose oxidoreductase precursor [Octadecabacter temperatus]SIO18861.1 Predicted dehydrogenase [Octadecabacter temperatus]
MVGTVSNPRTGVALIGAGMIAPTHLAALEGANNIARLHTVVVRDVPKASGLAKHLKAQQPNFTSDLAEVTENADVDVVIVATPPSVRIDLITQLTQAGKHILLEKPIGRTVSEAEQVVEICETADVQLGILVQHRMGPAATAAVQVINEGQLGALGHVEIAAALWRDQTYYDELGRGTYERDGGGVLITQAIHLIDLALSLTGPVMSVQAMTATTPLHSMEAEDFAVAGLQFTNGAVGSLVATTATFPHREETITLHFAAGSLRIERRRLVVSWRDGRIETHPMTPEAVTDEGAASVSKHDLHQAMIEDFIGAVRKGSQPIATGRDVLASHRLIEAIEVSSRTGRKVEMPG